MSSLSQPNQAKLVVLITGATGYIGGSVLYRLLNLPDAQLKYEFRAVVRNADKAKKLAEFGVRPVIGSHLDVELMEKEAKDADVVLVTGNSDDLDATEGIDRGMKKHFEATGKQPILIHTSGAGVIADSSRGDYSSDIIYDDGNAVQLQSIPKDAPHRPVELKAIEADVQGYAKTYIVSPSAVWDAAHHPLVEAGISNSRSMWFKLIVPITIKRGSGLSFGKGENIMSHVHIDELVDFYELLFTSVLDKSESRNIPHGKEGYFFLSADEIKAHQVYTGISKILFNAGKVKSSEPTLLTEEEAKTFYGPTAELLYTMMGGNLRVVSTNAKRLGWKPKKTTRECLNSLTDEVKFWVAETEGQ